MTTQTSTNNHGGRRLKAGRLPQVFHLKKEAAKSLSLLTGHKRMWQPDITELEVLEQLIDIAWHELNEQYQENAEKALEGE